MNGYYNLSNLSSSSPSSTVFLYFIVVTICCLIILLFGLLCYYQQRYDQKQGQLIHKLFRLQNNLESNNENLHDRIDNIINYRPLLNQSINTITSIPNATGSGGLLTRIATDGPTTQTLNQPVIFTNFQTINNAFSFDSTSPSTMKCLLAGSYKIEVNTSTFPPSTNTNPVNLLVSIGPSPILASTPVLEYVYGPTDSPGTPTFGTEIIQLNVNDYISMQFQSIDGTGDINLSTVGTVYTLYAGLIVGTVTSSP
jgi:hypothetical protein